MCHTTIRMVLSVITVMTTRHGYMMPQRICSTPAPLEERLGVSAQSVGGTENGYVLIPMLPIDHHLTNTTIFVTRARNSDTPLLLIIKTTGMQHLLKATGLARVPHHSPPTLTLLHPCIREVEVFLLNKRHHKAHKRNYPFWTPSMPSFKRNEVQVLTSISN
jgi:hypothetical protein